MLYACKLYSENFKLLLEIRSVSRHGCGPASLQTLNGIFLDLILNFFAFTCSRHKHGSWNLFIVQETVDWLRSLLCTYLWSVLFSKVSPLVSPLRSVWIYSFALFETVPSVVLPVICADREALVDIFVKGQFCALSRVRQDDLLHLKSVS